MKVDFKTDGTMVVVPECMTELMALKYWMSEFQKHGVKMLEVVDEANNDIILQSSY